MINIFTNMIKDSCFFIRFSNFVNGINLWPLCLSSIHTTQFRTCPFTMQLLWRQTISRCSSHNQWQLITLVINTLLTVHFRYILKYNHFPNSIKWTFYFFEIINGICRLNSTPAKMTAIIIKIAYAGNIKNKMYLNNPE